MTLTSPAPFGRVVTAMVTPFGPDGAVDLALAGRLAGVRQAIGRVIFGQDQVVERTLITLLAYKLLPRPRPRLRYAASGAVAAALAFELARRAFAIYLDRVARYDVVYGSIGSIIAFLVLVYIAAIILLWGAELGASLRRVDLAGRLRPRRGAAADGA